MPDEIRSGPGPKSNFLDDFSGMFRNKLAGPSYFDGAAELVNRLLAKPSASQNLAAWEYNRTPPMPNEGQQNMLGKLLSIVPENALLASNFIGPGARAAVPKLAVPKDVPLLFDSLSNGVIPDGVYGDEAFKWPEQPKPQSGWDRDVVLPLARKVEDGQVVKGSGILGSDWHFATPQMALDALNTALHVGTSKISEPYRLDPEAREEMVEMAGSVIGPQAGVGIGRAAALGAEAGLGSHGGRLPMPKLAVPKDVPLLFDSLSNGVIPDGWYVHGRAKGTELRSDAVIQATRNLDVADQYGRSGSKWALRPMDDARVLNLNDNDANIRKISQMMMADHRSGNLPYDIKEALGRSPPISTFYEFANEFAPPKIVTSAGAFDNPNWAQWLHDRTKADFVITPDGAVVLNKDAIEAHRYDHKIR